ncbi:Antibiotic biosynthesis monooxygenase [Vibrio chagasii]|jgi:quinol monooxygenase YgiN|uniref:putative quinol monooxygenase n=1 Tax=Vibrio TaxID=662 RepID=UPI000E3254E3|nr:MULTISPECIES: antibiotic biosynthesis monooxygenase [Vibrio]MCG9568754.1 antibiotic biosynthesis monooxygenase [Vibrio chagasii]MCG9674835.1 antibiotic biosynthesis monooxygenase [Vibrio chagasii]MCY9826076.1 antibiotic biosynthesis monooxygenase [Vibrio chagasii]MDA0155384.1 antibiotic biosynthesis monooxygenase [Vibrio sp. Makdt]NOI40829.1 antibiotic biosynthesis monooxygenase [Vibrio sp. 070316B]
MSKVILQGHILVPDNELELVTQALVVHKELTLAEPGCIVFRVSQSTLQPNRFEVYEEFTSREAFQAHQSRVRSSDWGKITKNVTRHYQVTDVTTPS